jgi:hypothetical protein
MADDGRLPQLIEQWKARTKKEEDESGQHDRDLKRKQAGFADVIQHIVVPVLQERAAYLKSQGFRVESGLDKDLSLPLQPVYRLSFEYPHRPSALLDCDEASGVFLFTAKTVGRSESEKRQGWEKRWTVETLTREDLETELRLFCEKTIEHLATVPMPDA